MNQVLLRGKSARIFGPFMMALGVGSLYMSVRGLLGGGELGARLALSTFLGLFGALLLVGGRMIAAARGGVTVTDDALELAGDAADDILRIPLEQVRAVVVHEVQDRRGDALIPHFVCEAALAGGVHVLLGESDDEHHLRHFGHQVGEATGHGAPESEPPKVTFDPPRGDVPPTIVAAPQHLDLHVGVGGSLALTLAVSGATMLASGVVLMLDLQNNNVLGFLFGPLLIALGAILGAIPAGKAVLVERLRVDGDTLHHCYRLLGKTFGARAFALTDRAYVRLRQRGLHGAAIEVASDGRILIVAGGVHRGTPLTHEQLLWSAHHLAWKLATR